MTETQNKTKFDVKQVQVPFLFKSSLFYDRLPTIENSLYDAIIGGVYEVELNQACDDLTNGIRDCEEGTVEVFVNL